MVLVAAHFSYNFGSRPTFLKLVEYTHGESPTPYQYRALPMGVFRLLTSSASLVRIETKLDIQHTDPYRFILIVIAFVSMLGAMYVTRLTIARLTGDDDFGFWAAFLVPYMALLELSSSFGLMYTLPYDVPALFFFAFSIYLIVSGRRWAFYLLFPLAVLNRETACFATVFFAIWEWVRLSDAGAVTWTKVRKIAPVVVLQAIVWIAIKIYLVHLFGHNSVEGGGANTGGLFVTKLGYNLREVVKPQQWPVLLSICGFSLPFLYLQRRWIRCRGLYYACAIILPLYLTGMMLVGVIDEIRIFTEWIALVVPALALIVHNRFRPVATEL